MDDVFKIFTISHISALAIIIIIITLIKLFSIKIRNRFIRYSIALILLIQEISLNLWYISNDLWSISYSLPLHLCSISIILSIIMLITKSKRVYEIVYFWGIGGAFQALLTPDLGIYTFPHYRYFQFFLSHGMILISVFYMTFVYSLRPRFYSIVKSFIILNLYALFISFVNIVTEGNYLYIRHKPNSASLLDYLGEWPWYIISLEGLALIIFFLLYLPFYLNDKRKIEQAEKVVSN